MREDTYDLKIETELITLPIISPGRITIKENQEVTIKFQNIIHTNNYPDFSFILKDGNAIYWVNVDNGVITGIQYSDRIPLSPDVNVSIEEAEATAIDFAQEMYPGFSKLVLTERRLIDHRASKEYSFIWTQIVDSALTPNTINISVNPASGEVCTYMSSACEIEPFAPPDVSGSEAKNIAKNTFQTDEDVSISEPVLVVTFSSGGEQILVWRVQVDEIVSPDDYQHGAQYSINAYTGEIVQTGVY